MLPTVAASRVLAGRAANLVLTCTDQNGEPDDPGTITVAVVDSQGNTVTAGAVTEKGTQNEVRTATITGANILTVDRLTAVWTLAGNTYATTVHDVAGGVYCTVADIRTDTALTNTSAHPTAALIADRGEVEYMIDDWCNRAFVPRFNVEIVPADRHDRCDLRLEMPDLREVVWANYWNGTTWTAITPTVGYIQSDGAGVATLLDGSWPSGPIQIGYRYGLDRPPPDLGKACAKAVAHFRHADQSGIPDRAISVQGTDLGNVVLATPGIGRWLTAVPKIDETLNRYKFNRMAV